MAYIYKGHRLTEYKKREICPDYTVSRCNFQRFDFSVLRLTVQSSASVLRLTVHRFYCEDSISVTAPWLAKHPAFHRIHRWGKTSLRRDWAGADRLGE